MEQSYPNTHYISIYLRDTRLAPMGFLAAIGALFSAFTDTDPIAVVIVCFIVLIVTIVLEVWLKLSDALLEKVTSS